MKVKTAELTGTALDWAVAKCEWGVTELVFDGITHGFNLDGNTKVLSQGWAPSMSWHPSTNWSQGGPIIEREGITVCHGSPVHGLEWLACDRSSTHIQHGPSYLIAAMRCFCASKLGEEVELPEKLI